MHVTEPRPPRDFRRLTFYARSAALGLALALVAGAVFTVWAAKQSADLMDRAGSAATLEGSYKAAVDAADREQIYEERYQNRQDMPDMAAYEDARGDVEGIMH